MLEPRGVLQARFRGSILRTLTSSSQRWWADHCLGVVAPSSQTIATMYNVWWLVPAVVLAKLVLCSLSRMVIRKARQLAPSRGVSEAVAVRTGWGISV